MNKSYMSFLICDHGATTDFYVNGIPIGHSDSQGFHAQQLGSKNQIPIKLQNLTPPFPFESIEEFKFHLIELIKEIEL